METLKEHLEESLRKLVMKEFPETLSFFDEFLCELLRRPLQNKFLMGLLLEESGHKQHLKRQIQCLNSEACFFLD